MINKCTTVKPGTPCKHMGKTACNFKGGSCKPIVEKCEGCGNIQEFDNQKYCRLYADPAIMWRDENCLSATHVERKIEASSQKINPLKASKRASKGR